MEFNISEPRNIVGMTDLMSNNPSKSISELENQIIYGSDVKDEENIASDRYRRDLERIAKSYSDDSLNFSSDDKIDDFSKLDDLEKLQKYDDEPSFHEPRGLSPEPAVSKFKSYDRSMEDDQLRYMTMEQKKQNYVDDVLQDITDDRDTEFDIDKEKEEDDRNSLIEQIDMLKMTLEDDGIDVSNIPSVNKDSSMNDIKNVYKILRLKNDRNRYCSFAEELILAGAYGVEYLFDGDKEWFGRKPDLVGWSNTVKVKLRRSRYTTSTFVKEIMQDYNFSSGTRLLLELVPSMFLYSRQKKLANDNNISSDMHYKEAQSNLNSL